MISPTFEDPALKGLYRAIIDTPIFDSLEDDVEAAHRVGVAWHPHWELEMRLAQEAEMDDRRFWGETWDYTLDDDHFPF